MPILRRKKLTLFVFFFSFAIALPCMHAGIGELDEFLMTRAKKAKENAEKSYDPHPEEITDNMNKQVGDFLKRNKTRRLLGESDDCGATNPIDRCWRCRADWETNRKRLADCVRGFGSRTTGGKNGEFYVVTSESDDDVQNPVPGTLRHAVIQEVPLWIIFSKSMIIRLQQELIITSNKTIDGRGQTVHIAYGAGLTLQFVENVIIHGIRIHHIIVTPGGLVRDSVLHLGLRTISDGDGINIYGSSNIWVDHNSFGKCSDGQIDAIMGSTAITISNNKFNNHDHVMLLGGSDSWDADKLMQVTVAFNRFGKGLVQRMPRVRFGFVHVVNNDYNRWEMYAIGGSSAPTIISQGNRFKGPDNGHAKEVTKREAPPEVWKHWQWRSEGDKFTNGAFFVESGPPFTSESDDIKFSLIKAKPGSFAGRLTRYAGALKCKPGKAC